MNLIVFEESELTKVREDAETVSSLNDNSPDLQLVQNEKKSNDLMCLKSNR